MSARAVILTGKGEVAEAIVSALEGQLSGYRVVGSVSELDACLAEAAPGVAFVDLGEEAVERLACIERRRGAVPFLAVARESRAEWVLQALRAGARDFVVAPGEPGDLRAAFVRALRREGAPRDHTVAVWAPVGGAGVTSLALALAERLHAVGHGRVLLLDLNLPLGGVAACLDEGCDYGPLDLVDDLARLDDELLFSRLARHRAGFWFVSAAGEVEDAEHFDGETTERLLRTLRPHFDAVVLDLPHDFTARTRAALAAADRVLFLAADAVPALKRAQAALRFLREAGVSAERLRIVRRSGAGRDLSDADVAAALGQPVAGRWSRERDVDALARELAGLPPRARLWRRAFGLAFGRAASPR